MAAKEAVIWPALTVACPMARRPGDLAGVQSRQQNMLAVHVRGWGGFS